MKDDIIDLVLKDRNKIKKLESENMRLREELKRLKSVVGKIDFELIDKVLNEADYTKS